MNYPTERGPSPYSQQQQYPQGSNSSYYGAQGQQPMYQGQPPAHGHEGDRGLGSSLLGAAAGGFAADKLGAGALGTGAGALAGAAGLNAAYVSDCSFHGCH